MSQHNNVDVVRLIVFLFAALLYIAYLCHFGERVTSQFDRINFAIDQCSWYDYPMEMQRILPMMSMMAQNPVLVEAAYLNIGCSREVLKKVNSIMLTAESVLQFNCEAIFLLKFFHFPDYKHGILLLLNDAWI